jgi:glycosyltransferase involved in cell wall biosynthesis
MSKRGNMPKNIGLNLMSLKYPNTGLYTFCKDLTTAILSHPSNYKYSLYLPKNKRYLFSNVKNFLYHKIWHKLYFPSFKNEISIWHNTVQGNNYYPSSKKIKKILTIHDLNYLIEKQNRPHKIKVYQNRIEKAIKQSDVLVCISEFTKNEVSKNLHTFYKPIYVIYNGCEDISKQSETTPFFMAKNKYLFSIGTILAKKNFHVLPCLLQNNELELIIAGNIVDVGYKNKILSEAKLIGVENRVHIIGPIPDDEKVWYYKNCEAFVFPSIAEGFGLPVIEAMHFEKPVFLSKHTSLPEIGGDCAYYFDDFEPSTMRKNFAEGMDLYKKLESTFLIKERANLFSWEKAANEYIRLYERFS